MAISIATPALVWAGPSVTVINGASNPVPTQDVDNPARQPFAASTTVLTNQFNNSGFGLTLTTVPAGKRLVIQFVSAVCEPTGAGGVVPNPLRLTTSVDNWFAMTPGNTTGLAVTSQPTTLYAEPGSNVNLTVFPTTNAATVSCDASISGYLITP
ncbi:MAG TPA: hypothetical protein VJN94_16410 [Candidatus Binataceae bacterium]|nr:hypothetical protein [Candidatus Binataceae bacterium]